MAETIGLTEICAPRSVMLCTVCRRLTGSLDGVSLQQPESTEIRETWLGSLGQLRACVHTLPQNSVRHVSLLSYLRLGLPTDPLPLFLITDNLNIFLISPMLATWPANLTILDFLTKMIFRVEYKIMKLLIMHLCTLSRHIFFPRGFKYSPHCALFSNINNVCSYRRAGGPKLHIHTTQVELQATLQTGVRTSCPRTFHEFIHSRSAVSK